jgi:hypothetical protein
MFFGINSMAKHMDSVPGSLLGYHRAANVICCIGRDLASANFVRDHKGLGGSRLQGKPDLGAAQATKGMAPSLGVYRHYLVNRVNPAAVEGATVLWRQAGHMSSQWQSHGHG